MACLGAGYFAQFHYDAWRRIEGTQLIGSCDEDLSKASSTGLPSFADLNEMLASTKPDLLDIITPPTAHMGAIRAAVEHGVAAVICQKPFCNSFEEAIEATELAERAGMTLVIHENFRFQPWYRAIRNMIDDGLFGDVCQITFRLRTGDGQGENAYLNRQPYFRNMPRLLMHETGVHWIDTFRYLMGEPHAVYSDIRKLNPVIDGEDAGYFILDFAGGGRAIFDGNRLLDHAAKDHRKTLGEALVEGTHGTATLDGYGELRFRAFGATESTVVLPAQDWPGFAGDCVKSLNEHVCKALRAGSPIENTARQYLDILVIEDAIYRSASEGKKIWGLGK